MVNVEILYKPNHPFHTLVLWYEDCGVDKAISYRVSDRAVKRWVANAYALFKISIIE